MSSVLKTAGKILLFVSLLSLAACSTPTTPTAAPTQDLNALRTEVAATVLAKVPQLCALTPTPTQPPTATPTVTPSMTPTVTATGAAGTQTVLGTPGTGTAIPDRAKYVSQTIVDGTRFAPNATFNMTWRLQNTGSTTWNTNYSFRFWGGDQLGAPRSVQLTQEVAPGETIDITVPMRTPSRVGEYRSRWVMANASQTSFKEDVYLQITVVAPGTATALAPLAATATATKAP